MKAKCMEYILKKREKPNPNKRLSEIINEIGIWVPWK